MPLSGLISERLLTCFLVQTKKLQSLPTCFLLCSPRRFVRSTSRTSSISPLALHSLACSLAKGRKCGYALEIVFCILWRCSSWAMALVLALALPGATAASCHSSCFGRGRSSCFARCRGRSSCFGRCRG